MKNKTSQKITTEQTKTYVTEENLQKALTKITIRDSKTNKDIPLDCVRHLVVKTVDNNRCAVFIYNENGQYFCGICHLVI